MAPETLVFRDFDALQDSLFATTDGSFTFIHVNIRSIRKYWDELCYITDKLKESLDAIVLTKINIPECLTQQFSIAGYDSHHFTRANGLGGGIAIFVDQKWLSCAVMTSFSSAELLAVALQNPLFDITLLAFYDPPNRNACQFIEDSKKFHWPAGRICMTGDLNIDLLKNKTHIVVEYLNTLADVGVEAAINLPTRIEFLRDKLVSSCLDHVNIRLDQRDYTAFIVEQKMSDHFFTGCRVLSPAEAMWQGRLHSDKWK